MKALGRLYICTGEDWVLAVNHILTEPVCPTAWIHPESDPSFTAFRCDADTLDAAIDGALAMA